MSISAMRYALDVLDNYVEDPRCEAHRATAVHFLEQAIAETEKQEPVAWREVAGKTTQYYDYNEDGRGEPLYAAPVAQCTYPQCQATNGCVGVCSKEHPDLARVGEVGVWDDKREWVGLATGEAREFYESDLSREELIHKIDEFLQEKNT